MELMFAAPDGSREAEAIRAGDRKWDVHLFRIEEGKGRLYLSSTRHPTRRLAEQRATAWVKGGHGDI